MEPSPKGVPESFESVRSKLRESLAAALSLVSQNSGKLRTNIDNSENQDIPHKVPLSEDVNPTSASLPHDNLASERPTEVSTGELRDLDQKLGEGKSLIEGSWNNELPNGSVKISHIDGQEFRMVPISSNGTVSNSRNEIESGHLIASCPNDDSDTAESEVHREAKRPKFEHDSSVGSIPEFANNSPQTLAVEIEMELFKLFGGVNKKYKERARSLLFNLKDRNNPELRERVTSGEIAPNRLCTMTAEDLASKELSEWRIAKAEELAQMVVLPDSDVDIRRLVKKTHKGEFQVEVERDDNISVEVGIGGTLLSKAPPKVSNMETRERLFATEVNAEWRYSVKPTCFRQSYLDIKSNLIDTFFGPSTEGVYSPSVQNTLYCMARAVLNRFPLVESVHLKMPNLHFLPVNLANMVQFADDVYTPTDEPHGTIEATLSRRQVPVLSKI